MDAKNLKTESALDERNNDGSKYARNVAALQCNRNKSYQDIGSNPLAKVDTQVTRPCAVIGPDRVVPPPVSTDAYLKKGPVEPWPCPDNMYRHLPEYQHKIANNQNPTRNISPRQTFQENMPRIMVPPTYNTLKIHDESNFTQIPDRSVSLSKNIKSNVPSETKYCDVPYALNPMLNEQKSIRNSDICVSSVQHPVLARMPPHGWPPSSVNLHASRPYGASEVYQYPEYPSCAGPRSAPMARPHRTVTENPGHVYSDSYYQEGNVRFKPYPNVKERYPQTRYEYFGNYSNQFHASPFTPNKYDIPKTIHPHPYPTYPHLKYLDKRMADPIMDGYQRQTAPQGNFNMPFRNQIIHPNYGPVLGNCSQNKIHSFQADSSLKSIAANKLPYENNNKIYIEYGNARTKPYPPSDNYFVNEMNRVNPMKNQVFMPNYQSIGMNTMPPHPYYKKDNSQMKSFDYKHHLRNPSINIINPIAQFSPTTIAISPTESNTSIDTTQTQGNSQEDCGYVSQSSTTSVRSMESANNRLANDYYRRYYDFRYGPVARNSPMLSRSEINPSNVDLKDKKQINLRQFIQMWNEGEEENVENNNSTKAASNEANNFPKQHEMISSQEQLYVLGLVNVSSDELSKYEHIQTVSKLPENIKGYNNIELLNQFEEVTESSNISYFNPSTSKEFQTSVKGTISKQATESIPRPVSPLDVEAKISQSVIHKEVGCNFEIKPCSPKMLNVEIASPVQNILTERTIEKVSNPLNTLIKSPTMSQGDENRETCNILKRQDHLLSVNENSKISSCKMVKTQFSSNRIDPAKTNYSLQDLESSSGVCLASLPRLDNDIELSFPEVNQQFINANKKESAMPTTYLKDWQEMIEQSDKFISKNKDTSQQEMELSNQLSPIIESEKEFTKLSKYRKCKYNGLDKISQIKTIRTDSVIIKNPENPKNYEENIETVSMNKFTDDTQQVPMNLTSQCNFRLENLFKSNMKNKDRHDDTEKYVDVAIDFSLNKTESNISGHNFAKNNISMIKEMPLQDENHLNVIQESIDTPIKYQHFEDSMSEKPNSLLASQGVVEVPRCEGDIELETDAQSINSNFSYKENVTKEDLYVVTEKKILDESTPGINSEIICGRPDANCSSSDVLNRENYLSIIDNDSVHTNDYSMEIINENEILNTYETGESEKCNIINASDIDDPLGEFKVSQTKKRSDKKSTTASIAVCSNDKESMPKLESYYNEALIGSPMEQGNEIQVKSESKIKNFEDENIAESGFEQILLSKDSFTEKPLLRNARIFQLDHKMNKKPFKSNVEIDQVTFEHSTRKTNDLFYEKLCIKNCKEKFKPTNKLYKRYFSKELYSPWIQNLLMYNDGLCCSCQSDINTFKTVGDKMVNIPKTDSFAAVPCTNYVTDEMNNRKEKDSKGELQLNRTKNYIDHSRECIGNITNMVENSIQEIQTEIIESELDHNRDCIRHKLQPELKDECSDNCTDIVDNWNEGSNIEELKPKILKGQIDCNRKHTQKITDIADYIEKEIQEEITVTELNRNPNFIDNTNTVDNNTEETILEELQPEITNYDFVKNRECFDNNITQLEDNGKETIKDEMLTVIMKVECYDKHTDIVKSIGEKTSIEELKVEITKDEFDQNCDCSDNIIGVVDSSRKKAINDTLHHEIIQEEVNRNHMCSNNVTDIDHNKKEVIKTEELPLEIMNIECDYNRDCIGNITKMVDNDKEDTSINVLQQNETKIECDHNRDCIDNITKIADNDEDIIDELEPTITKVECDHYRECIDNIMNMADNDKAETIIDELQPTITMVECDHYRECIDNIMNMADNDKAETIIDELQPTITKIDCDHYRDCIDIITKMPDNGKEETIIDELQPKSTKFECDQYRECINKITKMPDNGIEDAIIDQLQPTITKNGCDQYRECLDNNTKVPDNDKEGNITDKLQPKTTMVPDNDKEKNIMDELQSTITNVECDHYRVCIDSITKIPDNDEEETEIDDLQLKLTKDEREHDCECLDNNTNVPDNDKEGNITDKLQPKTTMVPDNDKEKNIMDELQSTITNVECDHYRECIDSITKIPDNDEEETIIEELLPKITKIEHNHYRECRDNMKMSDNNKEETDIDDLQLKLTKDEREQDCEYIVNNTNIPGNEKEETDIDDLQSVLTNTKCNYNRECIDGIMKMENNDKEATKTDESQPKLTNVECYHSHKSKVISLKDLNSKIISEFNSSSDPTDILTNNVDNKNYESDIGTFQSDLMKDDFYYNCAYNDVATADLTKSNPNLNLPKSLKEDTHSNRVPRNNFLKASPNGNQNDNYIISFENKMHVNPKCEIDNKVSCPPTQQIKNIHKDKITNEEINNLNDIGDTLKTFASLYRSCEERDIIKQDVDGKTKLNYDEAGLENEPIKIQQSEKRRLSLKRSLSDSALNSYYNDDNLKQDGKNISFMWPIKRKKINDTENIEPDIITENLRSIIQNNRRNSISSIYNEENISFCILIDNNCIITEENDTDKICYTELSEDCMAEIRSTNDEEHTELMPNIISSPNEYNCENYDSFIMECDDEKSLEESWVDDVACVETVVSDDIAEDIIISAPASPKDIVLSDNNESGFFSGNISEHTDKVKYIYGGKMCSDDINFLETLYKTPQMDVNKTLTNRECLVSVSSDKYYDKESLEKILSECNGYECSYTSSNTVSKLSSDTLKLRAPDETQNVGIGITTTLQSKPNNLEISTDTEGKKIELDDIQFDILNKKTQDDTVHSCESSIDDVFTYEKEDESNNFITSSSPEVSSTTSEEKSSSILLKITNYKGSRISQINDIHLGNSSRCKYTEKKDYSESSLPNRPLITKAAKKYIPPLKESIPDLKVKLSLPQQSLIKLKELKISKVKPKVKHNIVPPIIPKKPKPKFEDVLKSIDEIQFKMHKEKTKKTKNTVPKVVIKKNRNGSHYASTSNKETFNPDLTGRKWQPWVFIEKNRFIDKMAMKNKTRAVFNHRKNTYVLAEKFRKYKSVNHSKFIISQPKLDNSSTGHLKYTIRLKHF